MPRLSIGLEQVFTNLGIVGAGYKLYFYETGTGTPKTTYSDEGLTIPNTNPVVLNAAGRPDVGIWGSDSSLYRMVLGTPDSTIVTVLLNPVVDVDPVDSSNSGSLIVFNPIPTAFWGTTSGSSTNYTLDPALVGITSYSNTQTFFVDFHAICGNSPDIDINDLGVLSLQKQTGLGTNVDLVAGDVGPGRYLCANNGSVIIVLNPQYPYQKGNNVSQNSLVPIVANNGSDANNDIDFGVFTFPFSDGSGFALTTAMTKSLDVNWVAGTNQGGLDTGAKASNTWYHFYGIYNPTSNLPDFLFSLSATAPTLPSGYTKSKRLGAFLTDGSSNILNGVYLYSTSGYVFYFNSRVTNFNGVTVGTAKTSFTVSGPSQVYSKVLIAATIRISAGNNSLLLFSYNQADSVPTVDNSDLYADPSVTVAKNNFDLLAFGGTVYYRIDTATIDNLMVKTLAFEEFL